MIGSDFKCAQTVSPCLEDNIGLITRICGQSMDIIIRRIVMPNGQKAAAFLIDGLADSKHLGRDLFMPLTRADKKAFYAARELAETVLSIAEFSLEQDMQTVIETVLQGLTALFLDGDDQAVCMQAVDWPQRSVEEPGTDVVIRGPREGFIEALRPNVALLRRKIHHPDFRVETRREGRYSRTDVALVYVESIVNLDVLLQVNKRLSKIDIDAILDSGS
ncbi:MAG: spore germination protein, partial [Firmicutes bacterium]|nr:spore germination protein [Bacillota bacterium]